MNTTLNIRIEDSVKENARKTLASLGLDMSTAVKMFLNQVVVEKGIPFVPTMTKSAHLRAKWDKEEDHALKYGKRYSNAKEIFADILD